MKLKTFQKTLAIGVLAVTSSYAMQASAAPIFSFTEYGGFSGGQVAIADYSDPVLGDTGPDVVVPAVGDIYSTMSWNNTGSPQSSLELTTVTGPAALAADTWTTISSLTHNNVVIPNSSDWGPQDIWGRLVITDSDGGAMEVLDSDDVITIGLTETFNAAPCPEPNPVNTTCDDYFSFTAVGLADLAFTANDGSQWLATFRFANLENAVQIGETVYTGEGLSSSLDVQVMVSAVSEVPEPAALSILGLGLLGLGMMKRRKQIS